ncbi:MAG TPA: PQQ-binding-like beta-propeller repeat protein [Solirubrobacteraceae bacterium]
MNDDFITRLGRELRQAADREEQRSARARAVLTAQARAPRVARIPAVAVLVLGAILLVAVYIYAATRPEPAKPPPGPRVVARLQPGGALDQVAAGFGSAWVIDGTNDRLLRMDPATRRVTARIPLRAAIAVAVGRDAVWVGERINDLVRIDPRTNGITRIALARGAFSGGAPVPIGDVVWVVGADRALRLDTRSYRITKAIRVAPTGYSVRGGTVLGGDLWVLASNRQIVRFDGRTGARKESFPAPFAGAFGAFGNALYLADDNQVVRLDPATGHVVWRVPADDYGAAAAARGLLWADAPGSNGDRLVAADPRTGRLVASVPLDEFSVTSMERVGSELWLTTAGGHLVIVRL